MFVLCSQRRRAQGKGLRMSGVGSGGVGKRNKMILVTQLMEGESNIEDETQQVAELSVCG